MYSEQLIEDQSAGQVNYKQSKPSV